MSLIVQILARWCDDPTANLSVRNAQPANGASYLLGYILPVQCRSGFKWADGSSIKRMNCSSKTALWSWTSVTPCQGIQLIVAFHIMGCLIGRLEIKIKKIKILKTQILFSHSFGKESDFDSTFNKTFIE